MEGTVEWTGDSGGVGQGWAAREARDSLEVPVWALCLGRDGFFRLLGSSQRMEKSSVNRRPSELADLRHHLELILHATDRRTLEIWERTQMARDCPSSQRHGIELPTLEFISNSFPST